MPFRALRFDASARTAERWADALLSSGAFSVDVADAHAGMPTESPLYGDAGTDEWWPLSRLCVLYDLVFDVEAALARTAADLDEPMPMHSLEVVADVDWVRQTQAQFAPLHVADRLWIVPSWSEPIDPDAINLRIDPGVAFGTGSHPTTQLCLRWLAANVKPQTSVLDYGCGSGILAIAAAKLGAARVAGVDVDRQAIAASRANAFANGVDVQFGLPDEVSAAAFDLVVANILANPLELLAPVLARRVRARGQVALGGILESQAERVAAAYAQWFNIGVWGSVDGWVGLAGVRLVA